MAAGLGVSCVVAMICFAPAAIGAEIVFVSDFDDSNTIQWVQRHGARYQGLSIMVGPATVTARRTSNMGTLTLHVQVPPSLNGNPDYPDFSALKIFGPFSVGGDPAPGIDDCILVDGTIAEFNGATELTQAVAVRLPPAACGTPPAPYAGAGVSTIATDTDPVAPGNQPGPRSEALEGVLLCLSALVARTGNDALGDFSAAAQAAANGPMIVVGNTYYQHAATPGATFASICGVLDQQDAGAQTVFQLLPRNAADIQ